MQRAADQPRPARSAWYTSELNRTIRMSVAAESVSPLGGPRHGGDHAQSFAVGLLSTLLGHLHHFGRFGGR